MQDISQFQLLTPAEELELATARTAGSDEARQQLINSNLRLVVKIAHEFKGSGLSLPELVSEGNLGLMRAVEKFDPGKGARLSSYAVWWIREAMRRALLTQTRTIRIPVHSAHQLGRIHAARLKLTDQHQRLPSDAEIAAEAKLTVRAVSDLRLGDTSTVSLHNPVQNGEDGDFSESIPDEMSMIANTVLDNAEVLTRLLALVRALEAQEQLVLSLRFGLNGEEPKTDTEICHAVGLTRDRVRQIQSQAMEKLRMMFLGADPLPQDHTAAAAADQAPATVAGESMHMGPGKQVSGATHGQTPNEPTGLAE